MSGTWVTQNMWVSPRNVLFTRPKYARKSNKDLWNDGIHTWKISLERVTEDPSCKKWISDRESAYHRTQLMRRQGVAHFFNVDCQQHGNIAGFRAYLQQFGTDYACDTCGGDAAWNVGNFPFHWERENGLFWDALRVWFQQNGVNSLADHPSWSSSMDVDLCDQCKKLMETMPRFAPTGSPRDGDRDPDIRFLPFTFDNIMGYFYALLTAPKEKRHIFCGCSSACIASGGGVPKTLGQVCQLFEEQVHPKIATHLQKWWKEKFTRS
jgi:hypothetical protein